MHFLVIFDGEQMLIEAATPIKAFRSIHFEGHVSASAMNSHAMVCA
jgi:hypothetical protein